MNTTKDLSATRCGTDQVGVKADSLALKRADDLNLGDMVLFASWEGVELREVMSLARDGGYVLVGLGRVGVHPALRRTCEVSTSIGNTFRVVA